METTMKLGIKIGTERDKKRRRVELLSRKQIIKKLI